MNAESDRHVVARSPDRDTLTTAGLQGTTQGAIVLDVGDLRSLRVAGSGDPATTGRNPLGEEPAEGSS
jgi:hypothetical protein